MEIFEPLKGRAQRSVLPFVCAAKIILEILILLKSGLAIALPVKIVITVSNPLDSVFHISSVQLVFIISADMNPAILR